MAILGATGSIGSQALDLVRRYPERFSVVAMTAHSNAEALFSAVRVFRPKAAGLVVEPASIPEDLRGVEWFFGADCSARIVLATAPQDVLAAVVGIAGLNAVMAGLECAERILLANKEALVTGGDLVTKRAETRGVQLLPVDSEHSAIFQCLQGAEGNPVQRLILTASGGPFRRWNKMDIESASVEDALGHPTWRMGAKITVDCATMMNKGLEVIEAHHLFKMPADRIDVIVHPESIIHSMVEYSDGSTLAQMGVPDMRAAIGYAMGYPERLPFGGKGLNLHEIGRLTFEKPDLERFACLKYAYDALRAGGAMPIALNGANEVAVEAFLNGRIRFGEIARVVLCALEATVQRPIRDIGDVYEADRAAREIAGARIETDQKG